MATTLDYAGLADRRLSAKIELYDMVTAVTQRGATPVSRPDNGLTVNYLGINSQFAAMHRVEPTLQKMEIKGKKTVTMSAELGPPKVSLRLGTNDKTVLFYLYLKSGWFRWYDPDEEEIKHVSSQIGITTVTNDHIQ